MLNCCRNLFWRFKCKFVECSWQPLLNWMYIAYRMLLFWGLGRVWGQYFVPKFHPHQKRGITSVVHVEQAKMLHIHILHWEDNFRPNLDFRGEHLFVANFLLKFSWLYALIFANSLPPPPKKMGKVSTSWYSTLKKELTNSVFLVISWIKLVDVKTLFLCCTRRQVGFVWNDFRQVLRTFFSHLTKSFSIFCSIN